MLPFAGETVTLVRRSETVVSGKTRVSYEVHELSGCSWRRTERVSRSDGEIVRSEVMTCRVPAGQEKPRSGDLLVLGAVSVSVKTYAEYQALIEAASGTDGAFVVTSVRDNARSGMPFPHYAARG